MKTRKLLLIAGACLLGGFIWGQVFSNAGPHITSNMTTKAKTQNYSAPEVPVGVYDEMVSIDVIRNNDDIWVVDHYTGALIFEYNRFKEADKEAWAEYEDLLIEAGSKE